MERTGFRKPKHFLKAWADASWTKPLSPRVSVSMIDEWIHVADERASGLRKSWFIGLTNPAKVRKTLGKIRGLPTGESVILFEDDVLLLVGHLLESGLVFFSDDGYIGNGPEADENETPEEVKESFRKLRAKARKEKKRATKKGKK